MQHQSQILGQNTRTDSSNENHHSNDVSDDEDNEICVVETDDKPCSSDDSYTHPGKFDLFHCILTIYLPMANFRLFQTPKSLQTTILNLMKAVESSQNE